MFDYRQPKADQPVRYSEILQAAKDFAELIVLYCPESRERSLAFTKLEECIMWANAAIDRNE